MMMRLTHSRWTWDHSRWDQLGLDVETILIASLAVLGSALVALIVLMTNGSLLAGAACLAGITVLLITYYRLDWSVYLFIGVVLVFDQFHIPGFEPLTFKAAYFRNIKEIPYFPQVSSAVVNPLEIHLLLLLLMWFVIVCVKKNVVVTHVLVWGVALVFYLGLIGSFVYGLKRGGDFLPALWEIRALFYLGWVYFFIPQIIRTKEQLQTLLGVCIAAIAFKAFQGIARFVRLGLSFQGFPTLTNHEDPLFILTLIVFLIGLLLYQSQHCHRQILLGLLFPLLLGFFVAQRRAAYAAILPMFIVIIVLVSNQARWTLLKIVFSLIVVAIAYCAVFWNSHNKLASPVRLIKTSLTLDPATAGDRYYSNLYRKFEDYNLAMTVQQSPVQGIGFGNKYEKPLALAKISFPLRDYIPHNEVLWLLVKTGMIGFFLFFLFLDAFMFRGAQVLSTLHDPYLKAVCLMAIAAVMGQIVVSYFDLQLTYYRNMVYLGVLMGSVSTVETMDRQASSNAR